MAYLLALALCVFVLAAGPAYAVTAAPHASTPRIVAKPSSVMVDSATKLTGTHFSAATSVTLEECNASEWIVPLDPCTSTSVMTVTTNTRGAFKAVFTVKTCPGSPTAGTSERCYIGEPTPSGIDTVQLRGAVTVTVTFP